MSSRCASDTHSLDKNYGPVFHLFLTFVAELSVLLNMLLVTDGAAGLVDHWVLQLDRFYRLFRVTGNYPVQNVLWRASTCASSSTPLRRSDMLYRKGFGDNCMLRVSDYACCDVPESAS